MFPTAWSCSDFAPCKISITAVIKIRRVARILKGAATPLPIPMDGVRPLDESILVQSAASAFGGMTHKNYGRRMNCMLGVGAEKAVSLGRSSLLEDRPRASATGQCHRRRARAAHTAVASTAGRGGCWQEGGSRSRSRPRQRALRLGLPSAAGAEDGVPICFCARWRWGNGESRLDRLDQAAARRRVFWSILDFCIIIE